MYIEIPSYLIAEPTQRQMNLLQIESIGNQSEKESFAQQGTSIAIVRHNY